MIITSFELEKGSIVIDKFHDCVYAYFCEDDLILGDVWLFNVGETPQFEPWQGDHVPPYQNSEAYVYPHNITLPLLKTDFRMLHNPNKNSAGIYFREKLVGIIGPDTRPGKSAFAKQDSPVALKMTIPVPLPT